MPIANKGHLTFDSLLVKSQNVYFNYAQQKNKNIPLIPCLIFWKLIRQYRCIYKGIHNIMMSIV